ncbi:MAG: hypothetical protein V4719_20315 [Planctomycetota bacterium]
MIPTAVDILWTHTWWSYAKSSELPLSQAYHFFNLFEGTAWFVFCVLVLVRRYRQRRSRLELWYAIAFFTFGLTDFREAYYQQSWLIWVKTVNLVILFVLRHRVLKDLYPGSRLF